MIASARRATPSMLIPAAIILLAGWLAFGPSIHGGWVWDDTEEVTQNTVLRDPAGLQKIWLAPAGTDYFPLKTTVEWLQWRAWGGDPAGYHAVNIALHLLSAFLFWRLLAKLGLRQAWIGGLLFAVHPLAVESVAWVAELKNTLSLPFLLLAMLAYLDYDDFSEAKIPVERIAPNALAAGRNQASALGAMRSTYLLSLLFFLLAMLSKSSVVMLPAVILLYCWWKRGRIRWKRLTAAGLALAFYLGKCLWPFGLLPIYPRWGIDPTAILPYVPWLALALMAGWCWRRRAAWGRHVLFGLGFFALNLAPVLGLVAMSYLRISRVADHFAYLPLLGVIALVTAGVDQLVVRRGLGEGESPS